MKERAFALCDCLLLFCNPSREYCDAEAEDQNFKQEWDEGEEIKEDEGSSSQSPAESVPEYGTEHC
jgi:hypothetical protein